MNRSRATLVGFLAVVMWALLALLTVASAPVPPFQLTAICFAIGGAMGLFWAAASGTLQDLRSVGWKVYAFGTAGLFGYHALYFSALSMAPAAQAGLIAYLWPLLIVLFSGLLPGESLRKGHILGASVGFLGAGLIIGSGGTGFRTDAMAGYGLAFLCALTWAAYSVASRLLQQIPTSSVAVFCLATSILSLIAHILFEATRWPATFTGWAALLGLGLGPVGLAFYVWDVGVKRGYIQVLGAASYAAPLLSTLALILAGYARLGWSLMGAALLIAGGAALAAHASAQKS